MKSNWKERARSVIFKVIEENPDLEGQELKDVLSDAYPFGPREYYPYKVWLAEVKRILKEPTPEKVLNHWVS